MTWAVHARLLVVSAVSAIVVASLALLVYASPYLAVDDSIDRAIQSVNWGPLASTFVVLSFLGGPRGGIYMQAAAILLVLLLNRRGWLLALAVTAGGIWYPLLAVVIHRPRPTLAQVSSITEHPGATSFPSGHVIYITLTAGMLMLCLGCRYLPERARPIGWAVVAAIAMTTAIGRVDAGVHWPTDVLASIFIAGGWLTFVAAFRGLSDRAIEPI